MSSNVKALVLFPSESSCGHGPPLLGRVRACPRSPASPLVCGPPTPLRHPPRLWFPSPRAYPESNAFLDRPGVRSRTHGAPEAWHWVLRSPSLSRGPSGASQVTGPSSSHAPRLQTPPGGGPPHPLPVETPAAFRVPDPLGSRDSTFSRLEYAAHGLAYLRIPRDVTAARARLATDLPG